MKWIQFACFIYFDDIFSDLQIENVLNSPLEVFSKKVFPKFAANLQENIHAEV